MARQKRRKDGLLEKTFTYNGKQYHVYGATKAILEEKISQKKEALEKGLRSDNLTFREYYEKWLVDWEKTVKPSTYNTLKKRVDVLLKIPMNNGRKFGELRLYEIEPQHIKDIRELMLNHKYNNKTEIFEKGQSYSTAGINKAIGNIRNILGTAVNDHVLMWNPCQGLKNLRRTEEKARDTIHRALSREETANFLEVAKESWYYNLFRFMLCTGVRCGEAGALKLSDIKSDHLEIRRTLTRDKEGNVIMGEDAKTQAGMRNIPLNDAINGVLEDQRKFYREFYGDKITDLNKPLFFSTSGELLNPSSVDFSIMRICQKLNMDRIGSHAFRDTFATRAIEANMKPKTLQSILGHASISMTMDLYAHVMEDTKIEEMQKVNVM